jgi:hypothetical protein
MFFRFCLIAHNGFAVDGVTTVGGMPFYSKLSVVPIICSQVFLFTKTKRDGHHIRFADSSGVSCVLGIQI